MKTKFFHHDSMIVTIFAKFFNSLLIQSNLLQLIESVMSVETKLLNKKCNLNPSKEVGGKLLLPTMPPPLIEYFISPYITSNILL